MVQGVAMPYGSRTTPGQADRGKLKLKPPALSISPAILLSFRIPIPAVLGPSHIDGQYAILSFEPGNSPVEVLS